MTYDQLPAALDDKQRFFVRCCLTRKSQPGKSLRNPVQRQMIFKLRSNGQRDTSWSVIDGDMKKVFSVDCSVTGRQTREDETDRLALFARECQSIKTSERNVAGGKDSDPKQAIEQDVVCYAVK